MSTLFLNFPLFRQHAKSSPLHLHTPHITISELPFVQLAAVVLNYHHFQIPGNMTLCSFHENQFLDFEEEPVLFEASSPVGGSS